MGTTENLFGIVNHNGILVWTLRHKRKEAVSCFTAAGSFSWPHYKKMGYKAMKIKATVIPSKKDLI